MFGNIYVHQLRICHFLQGIWLIGNVMMVSRANYAEKYSQKIVSEILQNYWLVVSNMTFMVHFIYGIIIPTDEVIFFRGVGIPPTRMVCIPFVSRLCLGLDRSWAYSWLWGRWFILGKAATEAFPDIRWIGISHVIGSKFDELSYRMGPPSDS